ncbi:MAG TPA: TetR/AcrR family transcriptional regulator [Bacillota bacterium]|nr:TetR/AcrR family transcriptional regulator [Bacillota bacterium]
MGRTNNASQRQKEIIWALYDCLAEKGHEKVTVKEIARRAGLAPGIIHYYFDSKDQIVVRLAEALLDKYSSLLTAAIAKAASPEEKLIKAIDCIVDNMILERTINRVFFNLLQMSYEREELGLAAQKMFEKYRGFFEKIFEDIAAPREKKLLAAELVALTEGISIQVMVDPGAFDRDTVRRLIIESCKRRI